MTKLYSLILLLFCSQAWAVPLFVQTDGSATARRGTSPFAVNPLFAAPNVIHDQIFVWAFAETGSAVTISDNCDASTNYNTYTQIVSNVSDGVGGVWSAWMAYDILACTSTGINGVGYTVTATGGGTVEFDAAEYSGLKAAGFDKGPASANGLTSSAVTPTCASELLVGLIMGGDGGTNSVQGTGWTLRNRNSAGDRNPGMEDQIVTSITSYSATWASSSGTTQTSILTFKAATCSASSTVPGQYPRAQ